MKKLKIDKNIHSENAAWTFGKNIALKFDSHIEKSIPMYKETQWLCNEIADFFIRENSVVYDLGCSTGTYLKSLASRHKSNRITQFDVKKINYFIPNRLKFFDEMNLNMYPM